MANETTRMDEGHSATTSSIDSYTDAYGFRLQLTKQEQIDRLECKRREDMQEDVWKQYSEKKILPSGLALKKLLRKGVPPQHREWVWPEVSGASHMQRSFQAGYFEQLLTAATGNAKDVRQIELDLPRTFPSHPWLNSEPGHVALREVLLALSRHTPDVGYCQGMNFVAAILLLVTGRQSERVFWIMAKLLGDVLYPNMYAAKLEGCHVEMRSLDTLMATKLPALSSHLRAIGCTASIFATDWFLCLFATSLPSETLVRVWDALLSEGPKVLFRVALAILRCAEPELMLKTNAGEALREIKGTGPHLHNRGALMRAAFTELGSMPMGKLASARVSAAAGVHTPRGGATTSGRDDHDGRDGSRGKERDGPLMAALRSGSESITRSVGIMGRVLSDIPSLSRLTPSLGRFMQRLGQNNAPASLPAAEASSGKVTPTTRRSEEQRKSHEGRVANLDATKG